MRSVLAAACVVVMSIGILSVRAIAVDVAPDPDNPFLKAAAAIRADSPAATSMEYPEAPPFGPGWERIAMDSWQKNAAVFPLIHRARLDAAAGKVQWPHGSGETHYLNTCRHLANIVGDAAMYQHVQGDDHAAAETVCDLLGLSESLRAGLRSDDLVRVLVSIGIDAMAAYRLSVIATDVHLSRDPADQHALQQSDATALIKQLLDAPSSVAALNKMLKENPKAIEAVQIADTGITAEAGRALEQANRSDVERALVAMSLACHLYRFEKGRWPKSLDELATRLPRVPVDPWGDGKQTLGYVVVKGTKSGDQERPLVYSRCESQDGLFYRVDQPQFCFYADDGAGHRVRGGQFRDVTNWRVDTGLEGVAGPTTRPLK